MKPSEQLIAPITSLAHTVPQRDEAVREIELLLDSLYKLNAEGFSSVLSSKIQKPLADVVTSTLSQEKDIIHTTEDIKRYLNDARERLVSLPVVELSIAFSPSSEFISAIWKTLHPTLGDHILAISINPTIIAGATITYNGRIIDLSARKKLREVLSVKKQEMLDLMKSSNKPMR